MNALSSFFFFFVGQSLRRLFTEIRSMMKGVVVGFSQRNVVCVVASFSLFFPPKRRVDPAAFLMARIWCPTPAGCSGRIFIHSLSLFCFCFV